MGSFLLHLQRGNDVMHYISKHREAVSIAFQSLALHKTRSFLTMLGIVFGVGAVIAMLSIGEGARQESLEQIEVLGVRNVIIRSMAQPESDGEDDPGTVRPYGISLKDADAIRQVCGFATEIAVNWESDVESRTYQGTARVKLIGTTPEHEEIFNVRMEEGSFLAKHHLTEYSNVCVIGSEIKQQLFGFENPLNKLVKIDDQWFTVIGVLAGKKEALAGSAALPSLNGSILIPLTTAMAKFPREVTGSVVRMGRRRFRGQSDEEYLDRSTIDQIAVRVDENTDITEAASIISRLLKKRHNDQLDFTVTIPEQLIEQSQKTQSIFNIVMGAIAGISLLVGGIGIMNIMLASVLERTREIGVRRAIGATRTMIITQFLAEATMLSVLGGIAGILLGWGLTEIITAYAEWRTIVSLWSIILAFTVAAATGIVFGYFPARRAADKDVIEALRYE
ncbi:MAG: ABC transporter permease [Bacteroidetes bacterium]|nr:ABC transporter permease [Bacteroidota bacterium]